MLSIATLARQTCSISQWFLIIVTWTVLWAVDRDYDEAEQIEERNWWEGEKRQEGTVRGNIKEFVIVDEPVPL